MQIIKTVKELQAACLNAKKNNLKIGLVPTMGALHEGHASLIKAAKEENDFVVVSVFVNPTQFGPNEDLDAYPRTFESDCNIAEKIGANIVFAPESQEMYPTGEGTWVEVTSDITKILCGRSRPSHFRGVTTVVNKLFNISFADNAYFGQKDGQQVQVINKMVKDLFMPINIRVMPIIREEDGLAKSSRNTYLSKDERQAALILSKTLFAAEQKIKQGENDKNKVLAFIHSSIEKEPLANIDYVEIYSFPDLEPLDEVLTEENLIALAVKIGKTRLIDNIVVKTK